MGSFNLFVRPLCNAGGARQIAGDDVLESSLNVLSLPLVSLRPFSEVAHVRNAVFLSAVASRVRQNKIMREVNRILRPGNEVIDLPTFTTDRIPQ